MQHCLYLLTVKLLLLLIINPKELLQGGYISEHKHDELIIKIDGRLSEFSDNCFNDVSIENVNLENAYMNIFNFLEYKVDMKYIFVKKKSTKIITGSILYLDCYQFYFKYDPHNILNIPESINLNIYFSIYQYLYLAKLVCQNSLMNLNVQYL